MTPGPGALDRVFTELADEVAARVLAQLDQTATPAAEPESWRLLSVAEAAERIGRSPRWVRDRAKRGELPRIRLDGGALAFDIDDLRAFAEARRVALSDSASERRRS